jgi:peptidoglycan hydrolase-like protein with peptidoglycan-binding domain
MGYEMRHGPADARGSATIITRAGTASWDEGKHKRGTGAQGGQFVSTGSSGKSSTVGYDSKKGSGAGYGVKGGDARVKDLQRYLNTLGLKDAGGAELKVDGKLGPKTTAAIKRIQRKLGVKPDGLVTPQLLGQLRRASGRKKAGTYNPASRQKAATTAAAKKTAAKKAPAKKAMPAKKTTTAAKKAPAKKAAAPRPKGGRLADPRRG